MIIIHMLMRDTQNITSFVEESQEVAHAAVYAFYSIYPIDSIYNYSLRLTIFTQFRQFTHNSKS